MFTKDDEGTSKETTVPKDKQNLRVLPDDELLNLVEMGKRIQAHYGKPQDTEWAMENGNLFMLQPRPITTLGDDTPKVETSEVEDMKVIKKD